jgi:hypothetical protein
MPRNVPPEVLPLNKLLAIPALAAGAETPVIAAIRLAFCKAESGGIIATEEVYRSGMT